MAEAGTLRAPSLTGRIAVAVAVLLLAGGVIVSVAAFAYGRQAAQEAYDRLLVGAANDIAASISAGQNGLEVAVPVSAFQLLGLAANDRVAYRVLDTRGEVLTGYDDLPEPPRRPLGGVVFYDADFLGEPARYAAVTRRFAERDLSGTVEVIVGQTLLARRAFAFDITRRALLVLAGVGIAMVMLAAVVVRTALGPLDRLEQAIAARDPHDLTPVDTDVPREAQAMVRALNGFMGRIDQQLASMRNLISDAAHQLRTPVAALRAQADLAAGEPDPDRRDAIVARIHSRTKDLGHLLDQMLARALVIHRAESARRELVDLRDIALEVAEAGDHALISPGVEVALQVGESPVPALADALSLSEAVKNLLNNAVRHGQSPVRIGAGVEAGRACIWVVDSGAGPDAALMAQLGARFAGESARGGGSGLGLSIAAAVARACHGELRLDRGAEGFRAAILLPLAPEAVS
ncbi:HAMP domain-containing protein [Pseudooceanicola sp. 216_PA32_1]|uniref:histidine kinase n=1 Tax=Pseudooceanicola pacificus TaxID=2676438 RepID=A0A844WAA0_9RHOB|nr:sensor histidine kinase [Pseudooceanicola pacificus]MWB76592.1 HAMP domain-containing protein [Pseudooceanicola pacificus]